MNDFLQSIRNQSKDKRYQQNNRPRRSYDNNGNGNNHSNNHHHNQQQQHHHNQQNHHNNSGGYHRGGDNRNHDNHNHRKNYHQRPRQDYGQRDENLGLIKDLLESMVSHQAQALELHERRAMAEERKAEAIEEIASIISSLAGAEFPAMDKVVSGLDAVAREFEDEIHLDDEEDFFDDAPATSDLKSLSKDEIIELIHKMRSEGSTYNEVAAHLTGIGLPTFSGRGKWHAQTIHRLCQQD